MGDPAAPPLDLARIVGGLFAHEVDYILVGGAAAYSHGAARATTDVDICVRWDRANLGRVAAALTDLGAELRVEGLTEPFPVPRLDETMLANMELSTWRTAAGDVDILRGIPVRGLADLAFYDELAARSVRVSYAGTPVQIAALEDLIASKEGVDRPTDREALPELRALRDTQPNARPLSAAEIAERATNDAHPSPVNPTSSRPPDPNTSSELGLDPDRPGNSFGLD